MRKTFLLPLLLALVLSCVCCRPVPPTMPTAESTPTHDLGLHLLVKVTGDLSHKRPGWKEYFPLSFGTALHWDDLLRAAADAQGLVVCADLTVAEVPANYQGGLPCPRAEPVLTRGESLVVGPRRDTQLAPSIPYILSPRRTFILTPHPVLQWQPSSSGIITYTVEVRGGSLDWKVETTATELVYPDNAPLLEPGMPYHLVVVDERGRSSEEEKTSLDLSFVLHPPKEIETIEALVARVRGLGLDDRAARLLISEIYTAHQLRSDAIALLEGLAAGEGAPAIHGRLGDLYLEIGLYREARQAYERALSGYRSFGDKAGEAASLSGLGLAYRGDGDDATARNYLEQAVTVYRSIGDADGANNVEEAIRHGGVTQ